MSDEFKPANWAGRKFIDNQTGSILIIPDDVKPKQFFQFGESFIDVGDGFYSRAGGDFAELDEPAITPDDVEYCPACGSELPDGDGAPCLCPTCGVRCCEGSV